MNIKRTGYKLYNYLSDGLTDSSPKKPVNNSLTKSLSFIHTDDEGNEKEVTLYINVQPIDINKEFVNLSFKYPNPEDMASKDLLLAVDKYKAVANRQDSIVKKIQDFLDKTYGVDSIENLPDKLTACEDVFMNEKDAIMSSLSDDLSSGGSVGHKLKSMISDFLGDIFKPSEKDQLKVKKSSKGEDKSLTFQLECTMVNPEYGDPVAIFPGVMELIPKEDRTKVSAIFVFPVAPDWKMPDSWETEDAIELPNSKEKIQQSFWNSFYDKMKAHSEEEKKSFFEKFGVEDNNTTKDEDTIFDDEGENGIDMHANSSKKLRFTMQKIESHEGFDFNLTNIFASYEPTNALADINVLLEDPSFVSDIPVEQNICYDISVADDGYEVTEISEAAKFINECRAIGYGAILDAAYKFYFDCKQCEVVAAGIERDQIQNYCCNYKWRIEEIIDSASKMVVEDNLLLIHPITRISNLGYCGFVDNQINWVAFTNILKDDIANLISAITLYQANFSEDKQKTMEGWLRSWNIELNYNLSQATKF